jgi:hypothetical protein
MELGLLDLSIELSTRDLTAGKEFALFVLVKNPYNKPVWIYDVNVSLPSDLKLANTDKFNKQAKDAELKFFAGLQKAKDERTNLLRQIEGLQDGINLLNEKLNGNNGRNEQIEKTLTQINKQVKELQERLDFAETGLTNVTVNGGKINTIKIGSETTELIVNAGKDFPVEINKLEIYAPWLIHEEQTQAKIIRLESSLPVGAALQPGSTVVYTAVLNIKKPLIFTPSQYRLQFYVNYSFSPVAEITDTSALGTNEIHTNTISQDLSIRPSVYSVLIGAIIGGAAGSVARLLQLNKTLNIEESAISLILAAILSAIAVIFMVRKSETQSFVSIEDFWGGLLIGFLVGYTGTSFFENLTKISPPKL